MLLKFSGLLLALLTSTSLWASQSKLCHYQTWDWDTKENRSVNHKQVVKAYSDLTPEERGVIPACSICEEDQVEIRLPDTPTFKVCKIYKEEIVRILKEVKRENFPLISIIGYRVGKSLGKTDSQGRRTKFSTHSYGLAIDFNSEINGMYNSCQSFNEKCKLIHGGNYQPHKMGALHPQTTLYKELSKLGFKWGGELFGRQKDFMHFSKEKL